MEPVETMIPIQLGSILSKHAAFEFILTSTEILPRCENSDLLKYLSKDHKWTESYSNKSVELRDHLNKYNEIGLETQELIIHNSWPLL